MNHKYNCRENVYWILENERDSFGVIIDFRSVGVSHFFSSTFCHFSSV